MCEGCSAVQAAALPGDCQSNVPAGQYGTLPHKHTALWNVFSTAAYQQQTGKRVLASQLTSRRAGVDHACLACSGPCRTHFARLTAAAAGAAGPADSAAVA